VRAGLAFCIAAVSIACAIDQRTELTEGTGAASGTGNIGGGGFGGTSGGTAATGGNGGTLDAGSDAGAAGVAGGGPSGGGTGGIVEATVEYIATVADCVGASAPNPDTCATSYAELHLDVSADFLGGATSLVYLRFDIDNQLDGAKILATELELGNINDSNQSGEVHAVSDFTRDDLFVQAPTLGPMVAPDLGPVSIGQAVLWKLGNAPVPSANKPFCLGLSTTTTDGIGYATLGSGAPPKLRVTFSK
jgi:hypothetical protein